MRYTYLGSLVALFDGGLITQTNPKYCARVPVLVCLSVAMYFGTEVDVCLTATVNHDKLQ